MAISKAEKLRRMEERDRAIETVKSWLSTAGVSPGHGEGGYRCDGTDECEGHQTLHTVLTHVSRSGMRRKIKVLVSTPGLGIANISYAVARALEWKYDDRDGAVIVDGCGMDMGFHLIYSLSSVLYGHGDRGGYRIRHNWL